MTKSFPIAEKKPMAAMPVSYTHLDVYKRQGQQYVARGPLPLEPAESPETIRDQRRAHATQRQSGRRGLRERIPVDRPPL